MAHVIHSINTTVNGGCHHEDVVADEAHHEYALRLLARAEGMLLGRTTFDLFAGFWPAAISRTTRPQGTHAAGSAFVQLGRDAALLCVRGPVTLASALLTGRAVAGAAFFTRYCASPPRSR